LSRRKSIALPVPVLPVAVLPVAASRIARRRGPDRGPRDPAERIGRGDLRRSPQIGQQPVEPGQPQQGGVQRVVAVLPVEELIGQALVGPARGSIGHPLIFHDASR